MNLFQHLTVATRQKVKATTATTHVSVSRTTDIIRTLLGLLITLCDIPVYRSEIAAIDYCDVFRIASTIVQGSGERTCFISA
ncbi:hypothetical protein ES703_41215 [subsurface metagenome]